MPINRADYPKEWEAFSLSIRAGRALHRCECTGECGLHQSPYAIPDGQHPTDLRLRRCTEINRQMARFAKGRIILTVAHLCNCYPLCAIPEHVKAMCQRCHLRVDRFRHAAARLRTQATPSYKSQRYRNAGKQFGIENLDELVRLPERKRRARWINRA